MIDLYTWTTPNGRKVSIMLEETGLSYNIVAVDIDNNEQMKPEFLAINPNHKIPAIVDHDVIGKPRAMFESGAILIYLAEKTGKYLPKSEPKRGLAMQWLMYQMSQLGPILGQTNHFLNIAEEKIPYAIQRFIEESLRIMGVLNTGLEGREYFAEDYTIADMAMYPWVAAAWQPFKTMMPEKFGALTNLDAWVTRIQERPAVQRGMAVPK